MNGKLKNCSESKNAGKVSNVVYGCFCVRKKIMNNYLRYCSVIGLAAFSVMFFLSGCQESAQTVEPETVDPGRMIIVDCIADYYNPDGSRYVSEQSHIVEIDNRILRVRASEPAGDFEWLLKEGIFAIQQNLVLSAPAPTRICDENIAKGLLGLYLANIDDIGLTFSKADGRSVKIAGKLYQTLADNEYLTFCKNLGTDIVDTIWLTGTDGKYLTVCGYDYKKLKTIKGIGPRKIEIFSTDADRNNRKLLVQYSGVIAEL